MIIFDSIEKKQTATFYENERSLIEPQKIGDVWFLPERLLPLVLKYTVLSLEDLEIRELTKAEEALLNQPI